MKILLKNLFCIIYMLINIPSCILGIFLGSIISVFGLGFVLGKKETYRKIEKYTKGNTIFCRRK